MFILGWCLPLIIYIKKQLSNWISNCPTSKKNPNNLCLMDINNWHRWLTMNLVSKHHLAACIKMTCLCNPPVSYSHTLQAGLKPRSLVWEAGALKDVKDCSHLRQTLVRLLRSGEWGLPAKHLPAGLRYIYKLHHNDMLCNEICCSLWDLSISVCSRRAIGWPAWPGSL